jgi:predicted TIM-barrel fold metal-dependent hydrolase
VSHLAALFGHDTRTGNEAALASCGDDPLFRVFAVLDARDPGWRGELDWAAEAGAGGIRVAPGFHGYPAADLVPVIDACAERGLPLQLFARLDDARVRHAQSPARDLDVHVLADLVRSRPTSPLLLSGLNWSDWTEFRRHLGDTVPPSIHLDLWHVNGPTHVADRLGDEPGRWVFGSGFPVQTPEATMLQLTAAALPQGVLRSIVSANAASISQH